MMGTWLLTLVLALEPVWGPEESIPVQASREGSGLASFDAEITDWMHRHQVPGAALAVGKDGNLVLARGYGFADHGARQPVKPDSLFRVASVSKPLTGIAVLRLLETGPADATGAPVTLDTPVMRVLDCEPFLLDGQAMDPRWDQVTLRHLLHHTGGWDRDESFDPMLPPFSIAERMGIAPPAGPLDVVRYMLGQPLDFDPGTRHAYSNFGYCLLGRVIEAVSGTSYEDYVRSEVLGPLGIGAALIGASLEEGRAPGEVRYYHEGQAPSVFRLPYGHDEGLVAHPYGGFALEPMDAHGGWVASAPDLVRLAM
ncbi:MAG: serine hydrolase, partial [Armatimonadia bacterium]|nr:serine hydrolase [Armatimonadia bacterium]